MKRTVLMASLLLSAPLHAQAQVQSFPYTLKTTPEDQPPDPQIEKRYSASFKACQKVAVSTPDIAACFGDEFGRQDASLNRAWRVTFGHFRDKARTSLLAAQRKWVSQRDPFCKSVANGFQGGTMAPIAYSDCRVEQTIRRTIWLERLR